MTPEVSVIMPVRDGGAHLAGSLASIARQTLREIEIILVDDGSSDGSTEQLDAFAASDSRARVVHLAAGGIVPALNAGVAIAHGRYIARMDGDDIAHLDRLERQRDALDADTGLVAVGGLCRFIDATGATMHVQRATSQDRQTDLTIFPPFVKTVPHPTLMVRGTAMHTLGGYRACFPHAEDHDLFLRLAPLGRIVVLPIVVLDYRLHGGAASSRYRDVQLDSVVAAQRLATDGEGAPPDAWALARQLLAVEQALDRRDASGAARLLASLLAALVMKAPMLRRDMLAGLTARAACCGVRLAYLAVRIVGNRATSTAS